MTERSLSRGSGAGRLLGATAAAALALAAAACDPAPEGALGLDSVSEDVLTLPAPAGHHLRSAATDGEGRVWFGSLDGGLSVLDPHTGRFHLLTAQLEPFGTGVEKIVYDAARERMILKVGYGEGRLVAWPTKGRPPVLIEPPRVQSRDHTRFDRLDTRPASRRWVQDFAVAADGHLWAARLEPAAGIFANLDTPRPVFLPAPDRTRAAERLAVDPSGYVWAVSGREATAWDSTSLVALNTLPLQLDLPAPVVEGLHPSEQSYVYGLRGAAVLDGQLWVAAPGAILTSRGDRLAPAPLVRVRDAFRWTDVQSGTGRLWLQVDQRLLNLRRDAPRLQTMPPGYLPERAAHRILDPNTDGAHTLWFGSSVGVTGYDPAIQAPRLFSQPHALPAAQPRYRPPGANDRWRIDPLIQPEQLLNTRAGVLLSRSGQAPARYNGETGLLDATLPMPASVTGFDVVATASSYDGSPTLLLHDGVARWDAEVGAFSAPILAPPHVLEEGRQLEIALDQMQGIVALSCPSTEPTFRGRSCEVRGYLANGTGDFLPVNALAARCVHLIDNGSQGWWTSARQAVLTCSPEQFIYSEADLILPGTLRETLREALLRLVFPQNNEFVPLTAISSTVPVAWGHVNGRPAVWYVGEPVRVLDDVVPIGAGEAPDYRRFAVDAAGNLCALTDEGEEVRVRCINAFGSEVAAWIDTRGVLGAIDGARLVASPSGHLWIDGLRGRVAWLSRTSADLHVVDVDTNPDAGPHWTRPLSRVLGVPSAEAAWVESDDILEVSPRLTSYGNPTEPIPMSATRLHRRKRWPMAAITVGSVSQLIMALPQELFMVGLSAGEEKSPLTAQPLRAEADHDVGPHVQFIEPGNRPGEVWVGLRDGGVLHFRPGRSAVRFSRAAGIATPSVQAITAIGDGAVIATPDGLYWLEDDGRSRRVAARLKIPQLSGAVVALESIDDGPEVPGTPLFVATSDRVISTLRLPVETPRAVVADPDMEDPPTELWAATPLTPHEITRFSDVVPVSMLVVPGTTSSSGADELLVGTNNGLRLIRRKGEAWDFAETIHITRAANLPTSGEVTAMAALPDGRVAAAYWNEVQSYVLLHDTHALRTWTVRLKDPSTKVYALAATSTSNGSSFLAVRQSGTLALSTLPIFLPVETPRWPWAAGAGVLLLILAGAGIVLMRQRNPLLERLRVDPDALREVDLPMLGEAHRNLKSYRKPILAAAGVDPRRWEAAVALGDAWHDMLAQPTPERRGLVAEVLCHAIGARFKQRHDAALDDGAALEAFTIELPRLPINLPTSETTLLILGADEARALVPDLQPRSLEDALGSVLRDLNQSMGTPFLLATNLPDEVNIPALIHARYPALILRPHRLRDLALHDQPRRGLSQVILTDCWLDAISPYKSSGPVEDPAMFVGRERERRELVTARNVSAIICGGRRVGKTSLIKQLVRDLATERPDMAVHEISLLGIRAYTDFVDRLERRLGINVALQDARASAEHSAEDDDPNLSPALARLRRRRARRSNTSLSPDTTAAAIHEALEAFCAQQPSPPLLILDEIDGIAARDAEAGYPLLAALHQLKSEGLCSFVLVGFAELYRQTFDYDSPLYNFARVLQLGPLDPHAARRLILEPMARLGVELEDDAIADRVVEATAGFPNLVQFIGDMLLRSISTKRSTQITHLDLDHILDFTHPNSQPLSAYVAESFDQNVSPQEEVLVYTLLLHGPRPATLGDIATNLERLRIETDLAARRAMVRRLKLVGVLKELPGEHYDLALPLLVQLLQAKDLQLAIAALTA